MRVTPYLLLALGLLAGNSFAKDLGVQGTLWPILEVDMRKLMVEDAAKTDWTPAQEAVKDSAKSYLANLPKRRFESPDVTQTLWVDPSIVLESDIQAPVKQANGAYAWKVLAAKGTLLNPLEKFRPVTAFLVFDGADEKQLALVKEVLAKENTRIVPVEAGSGDLSKTNESLRRPVFYASDAMLSRFKVRYLPSLVYPGFGPRELYLGTTSYALPYRADEVLATWPSLGFAPKPTSQVKK
jgi:conjugal transfer pilus assembly protein TraW